MISFLTNHPRTDKVLSPLLNFGRCNGALILDSLACGVEGHAARLTQPRRWLRDSASVKVSGGSEQVSSPAKQGMSSYILPASGTEAALIPYRFEDL